MADSWKLVSAIVSKDKAQAALVAQEEDADWPWDWVLTGMEVADDRPDEWTLEVFLPGKPSAADKCRFAALFGNAPPKISAEKIADQDWLVLSQQGIAPIDAGRFHVRTDGFPAAPGKVNFVIPASQAFGTGHHATTAGCLEMLDLMKRQGNAARNIADIGTGTGLLAFAAMHLWPRALATASDIDPVCALVVADNAALNGVRMGARPGSLTMAIAPGMADPLLQARAPYDLFIANILAGPLVELAEEFAAATAPGGNILLAGLLETQEQSVRAAYRRQGLRLHRRKGRDDWSVLWLRKSRLR